MGSLRTQLALIVLGATITRAATVRASKGDIFYINDIGSETQLTSTGADAEPSLSPDGSTVIFVRDIGDVADPNSPSGKEITSKTQIWTITLSTREARMVANSPVTIDKRSFYHFVSPQLSPDNTKAYFSVYFAATSGAVLRVDIRSGDVSFFTTATEFAVVPRGRYKGDLIVRQRRAISSGGYSYWFWLFDANGREIRFIGKTEDDVSMFLKRYEE